MSVQDKDAEHGLSTVAPNARATERRERKRAEAEMPSQGYALASACVCRCVCELAVYAVTFSAGRYNPDQKSETCGGIDDLQTHAVHRIRVSFYCLFSCTLLYPLNRDELTYKNNPKKSRLNTDFKLCGNRSLQVLAFFAYPHQSFGRLFLLSFACILLHIR